MITDIPSLAVAGKPTRVAGLAVPLLAGLVLAIIGSGLWLMGAPIVVIVQTTLGLSVLLWLRAHLSRRVA